jgi:hypothetical protein
MALNPGGAAPPTVPDTALWLWDTSGQTPVVSGYPIGNGVYAPTKTGLTPQDLQNFVGVPLQYYGNPPVAVASGDIQNWIRYAEDMVEQETSILLCQTWVASPPALSPADVQAQGLIVNTNSGIQELGFDYDLEDFGYDFVFNRAQDEGWSAQVLRYHPLKSTAYNTASGAATMGTTAIKNWCFIYPLLNTFFRVPPSWIIEDRDFSYCRLVPSTNVQMLPLFAMQLAFMGFAESVPGCHHIQYTAGLTQVDYQTRFSFMKELVLATASITALSSIQGTINLGAEGVNTIVDGLQVQFKYPSAGPFAGLISQLTKRRELLLKTARTKVSGPMMNTL